MAEFDVGEFDDLELDRPSTSELPGTTTREFNPNLLPKLPSISEEVTPNLKKPNPLIPSRSFSVNLEEAPTSKPISEKKATVRPVNKPSAVPKYVPPVTTITPVNYPPPEEEGEGVSKRRRVKKPSRAKSFATVNTNLDLPTNVPTQLPKPSMEGSISANETERNPNITNERGKPKRSFLSRLFSGGKQPTREYIGEKDLDVQQDPIPTGPVYTLPLVSGVEGSTPSPNSNLDEAASSNLDIPTTSTSKSNLDTPTTSTSKSNLDLPTTANLDIPTAPNNTSLPSAPDDNNLDLPSAAGEIPEGSEPLTLTAPDGSTLPPPQSTPPPQSADERSTSAATESQNTAQSETDNSGSTESQSTRKRAAPGGRRGARFANLRQKLSGFFGKKNVADEEEEEEGTKKQKTDKEGDKSDNMHNLFFLLMEQQQQQEAERREEEQEEDERRESAQIVAGGQQLLQSILLSQTNQLNTPKTQP